MTRVREHRDEGSWPILGRNSTAKVIPILELHGGLNVQFLFSNKAIHRKRDVLTTLPLQKIMYATVYAPNK